MKKFYWFLGFLWFGVLRRKTQKLPPQYLARIKDWHAKHGKHAPPIVKGKNGLAQWLNRSERRRLGFKVKQ
jgi:hypothetical protein